MQLLILKKILMLFWRMNKLTTSDSNKMFKQLKNKQQKLKRFKKYNRPKERSCGRHTSKCIRCGRTGVGGFVSSYDLRYCRCCFREIALDLGFKKYS